MEELPINPFTPALRKIYVGNLSIKDVLKLLTVPTPDFIPIFAPDAVEYIYDLTNGQPFLVQLIAHCVTEQFNRELDKGHKPEQVFILDDVDAILTTEPLQQFSQSYFQTLRRQLETLKPGSNTVLQVIAQDAAGVSAAVLEQNLMGRYQWIDIEAILAFLHKHQIIKTDEAEFRVVGELLRREVA